VVLNLDQPDLLDLVEPGRTVVTFALEPVAGGREADLCAEDLRLEGTQSRFRLVTGGQARVEVRLPVPGRHNVANALAAAAAARCLDISFADIAEALGRFPGVGRRFELVGYCRGAAVVDDYAHHPTEIRATLAAARGAATGRVIAIFQPHLFTRTRDFLDEFAHALLAADEVFVTDIYAARERPIPGVSGEGIVIRAREIDATKELHYLTPKEAVIDELMPRLEPGDLVLTMGAGDIRCVAEALVQQGGERK
jgi:UDP-N-acetylmuramate--alanine ligase